jgi:hypothetical protein
MSVLFDNCGGFTPIDYELTQRFPVAYNSLEVMSTDANGNPTQTAYYFNGEIVFTTSQTWNSQGKELTWSIYKP